MDPAVAERIGRAFERGSGHGLLQLGAGEVGTPLLPVFSYWREFGTRFVTSLCSLPDGEAAPKNVHLPLPPNEELERLAFAAPMMTGAEYLSAGTLAALWDELNQAFVIELSETKCTIQDFLRRCHSAWNLVGRVHFNLAENRKDEAAPFAFLATYTTQLSVHAKA